MYSPDDDYYSGYGGSGYGGSGYGGSGYGGSYYGGHGYPGSQSYSVSILRTDAYYRVEIKNEAGLVSWLWLWSRL